MENEVYIKKLIALFHECEEIENMKGLHLLYEIFKNIFLLNKNALFEIMFAEDIIFDVVGALEYDPAGNNPPRRHRHYLMDIARFKEVSLVLEMNKFFLQIYLIEKILNLSNNILFYLK